MACFLAWEWWESDRNLTSAGVQGRTWSIAFVRVKGETTVIWAPRGLAVTSRGWWINRDTIDAEWTEMEVREQLRETYPDIRLCGVPDAVVGISFLGLWGGWMAWQWQRRRKFEGMKMVS